jgi:hypothetical protein
MRILHLTPGTGNFHCGSCLRDHALIKALRVRGHDALMAPLYLPLVTDREFGSQELPVQIGGISLFIQQKFTWFHKLPRFVHNWINKPDFLRLASKRMGMTSAKVLGEMALGALLGTEGRFDPCCQQGGGFGDGRHAKPQRQVGQQQGALQLAHITEQPVEHPRAVEHAVHQHQWSGGSGDRDKGNLLDSKALLAALAWTGRRDPRPN